MITKWIWEELVYKKCGIFVYTTNLRRMGCLLLSIITVPIDIILLPLISIIEILLFIFL